MATRRRQMNKSYLNPDDLPDWSDSLSQIVVVEEGSIRTVYLSGQVAVDAEHNVIGAGDFARQADAALANLGRALAAAGAKMSDVVRLGIFVKDYRREHAEVIGEALRRAFGSGPMPASTWLGVATLAVEELLIEIEATAVVGVSEPGD